MIQATYIDHMGSDLSVVNAARVSFGKQSEWNPDRDEPPLYPRDSKLINYLAKHKHLSPFGHAFASFHVKAPVFVARQLVKHKFLRWNEISRRYVDDEPEFYMPDVWRGRSSDKKQGSSDVQLHLDKVSDCVKYGDYGFTYEELLKAGIEEYNDQSLQYGIEEALDEILHRYRLLIQIGVAPEQARMVLPQSTMTEWYWSGSLDAFAAMCQLRCKPDTQYESRIVADQISAKMSELFPVSWAALMKGQDDEW